MGRISDKVTVFPITSVSTGGAVEEEDELSIEEPLQIVVTTMTGGQLTDLPVAVTMRTPGDDIALTVGFLFTEGIIRQVEDVSEIRPSEVSNTIRVVLSQEANIDLSRLDRNSFVSSSCGVCGKRSIAAVFCQLPARMSASRPRVHPEVVYRLNEVQRAAQQAFTRTGSIHAAALFNTDGMLVSIFEDVGRHNALDKLIGAELLAGRIPVCDKLLFLSGRASFELIQKAAMAGIPITAAVGAPSSLAVELARQSSMTLLGFVRDHRFNIYSDADRVIPLTTMPKR